MAGTVLGKDQIDKINAQYTKLYNHIKSLLKEDATPYEKMCTYTAMEYLNTTEIATIFMALPFISPAEKRALVKAAVDDVRHGSRVVLFHVPATDNAGVLVKEEAPAPQVYTPAPFKLNAATTEAHQVD